MGTADVYRALWRHKWFILLLTMGLVAATWFLTSRQTALYEASTLIRVQQRIEDPSQAVGALAAGERLALTYAKIAETSTVAERIFRQLGGDVPLSAIEGKVSAEPIRDVELLSISVRSSIPERAQLIANAAPRALQSFVRDTGTLRDQVITVERAGVPKDPASPNLQLNLALAFLLGLVFNGALALLVEVLGDRIHDPEELERVTGQSVLATVPVLQFEPFKPSRAEAASGDRRGENPQKAFGRALSG